MKTKFFIALIFLSIGAIALNAQTTEFTYQGCLLDGSMPPTANYDFEFRLFSVESGGAAISTIQRLGVAVSNGIFANPTRNLNGQEEITDADFIAESQ